MLSLDTPILSFLRSTLQGRSAPEEVVRCMDWSELMSFAVKQAILGVVFEGVKLCRLEYPGYVEKRELMRWFVASEKIRKRNLLLNQKCVELQKMFSDAGFRSSILKGQGLAKYYSEEIQLLRKSGDIDVYVDCGMDKAMAYAVSLGQKDVHWDYKHLHLRIWDNVSIELHYRVEIVLNPIKNNKLQRWFDQNKELLFCDDGKMVTPTLTMNLFYILLHMYHHFFGSGIGLKQLIDYFYVVRSANGHFGCFNGGESINDVLKKFGMSQFAGGIMWLLHEVAGLDQHYMFCHPQEKEGRYILKEMLASGNLGLYDERVEKFKKKGKTGEILSICKHNAHLLRMYRGDALMSPLWYVWHKIWIAMHK